MYGRAHTHHTYVLQYVGDYWNIQLLFIWSLLRLYMLSWVTTSDCLTMNLLKNAYAFSKGRTAFPAYSRQVVKKAGHLPRSLKTCSFSCGLLEGKGHVCVSSMSITIETTRPTWFGLCCVFFFSSIWSWKKNHWKICLYWLTTFPCCIFKYQPCIDALKVSSYDCYDDRFTWNSGEIGLPDKNTLRFLELTGNFAVVYTDIECKYTEKPLTFGVCTFCQPLHQLQSSESLLKHLTPFALIFTLFAPSDQAKRDSQELVKKPPPPPLPPPKKKKKHLLSLLPPTSPAVAHIGESWLFNLMLLVAVMRIQEY